MRPALDEASASLAEALQTSFYVLTFVIVLLLFFFLTRGFITVQPDTKAIILRFGRTDLGLVKDVGLHYALPYPIDSVEIIPVNLKKLEVNTFWPATSQAERQQATERGAPVPPPIKGSEGAFMLTGDLNILEARWDVTYRVRGESGQAVIDFFKNIGQEKKEVKPTRNELGQLVEMPPESNEEVLIRTAVQSAVVRQLGRTQVSDIYPQRTIDLSTRVKEDVEKTISSLHSGLVVEQVNLIDIRPPVDVKAAFDFVLQAKQGADEQRARADQERQKILIAAAGEVGVAIKDDQGKELRPGLGEEIEKWWAAKSAHNPEEMQKRDAEIRRLFAMAGGQVRNAIAEARAYKIAVVESAKGDAAQVASLAALLKTSPREVKIFLDHARVDALQEVLSNSYETFLYHPDSGSKSRATLDLWLSRRAELLREMKKVEETR